MESPLYGHVVYKEGVLRVHMFSRELPPLVEVAGSRAKEMIKILRAKFSSVPEGEGGEVVKVDPLRVLQTLVWIVASAAAVRPTPELLEALLGGAPKSAVNLIFESEDPFSAYQNGGPLIPAEKLQRVSRIVVEILKLHGYPVTA